jgi:hypothetical protein
MRQWRVARSPHRYRNHWVSREPAYVTDLKRYARAHPTEADLSDLEKEVHGLNDRAVALIWPATTELALANAILRKFRPLSSTEAKELFERDGPIATFSLKTRFAYVLGIFGPQTRKDLDLIREIRNAFAHSRRPLRFSVNEVKRACDFLHAPDQPTRQAPASLIMEANLDEAKIDMSDPRTRYIVACFSIDHHLILTTRHAPYTILP